MEYTLPKEYLSASSISTFLNCPKQFEFRYIKGLIIPPNAALMTGTAMHRTLEDYYKDAMGGGTRLTGKQTAEMAVTNLDDVIGENDVKVSDYDREDAIKSLQDIAVPYIDNVGKHIKPLAVEEEIRYKSRCGVEILAYLDLRRELDNGFDKEGICDYKITTRKWTLDKLVNSLQFNIYSMITGIGDIEIHNMLKSVPKAAKGARKEVKGVTDIGNNIRLVHYRFDGSDVDQVENIIEGTAKTISSGIFMPCALDSWCCSSDWCGYWNLCRGKAWSNARYANS